MHAEIFCGVCYRETPARRDLIYCLQIAAHCHQLPSLCLRNDRRCIGLRDSAAGSFGFLNSPAFVHVDQWGSSVPASSGMCLPLGVK